jgi:hypothetical protein
MTEEWKQQLAAAIYMAGEAGVTPKEFMAETKQQLLDMIALVRKLKELN